MDWAPLYSARVSHMQASEIRELLKLLNQPELISFAGGIPDCRLFPAKAVAEAFAQALSGGAAGVSLQYSISEGYPALREWIVGEMAKLGVRCSIENVMITSGSQQGLDYLGKLLLSPGDTALVSWPTYLGALGAFNVYEPRYDRIPAADENVAPAAIAAAAAARGGAVKFAYCIPEFNNPTGETMPQAEREALLDLAGALGIAVIEDAAYQALRFDGVAPPPVLALDVARNGGDIERARTLYCGTFSKTLAPGLRIGWVVGAREMIDKLVVVKQAADLHTSTINQIVAHRVASTLLHEHVETLKAAYAHRRDCMLAALDAHMPKGVRWTRPDGGMFVWLTLPEDMDSVALLPGALREEKVAFVPGRPFFADGSGGNHIRLAFSCGDDPTIEEGIARLSRIIARAAR